MGDWEDRGKTWGVVDLLVVVKKRRKTCWRKKEGVKTLGRNTKANTKAETKGLEANSALDLLKVIIVKLGLRTKTIKLHKWW